MEIPTWEDIADKVSRNETLNPLENFIYENEPEDWGSKNNEFRADLQKLVDWMDVRPQVTCAECGRDCRYDGPFYCSEHQR